MKLIPKHPYKLPPIGIFLIMTKIYIPFSNSYNNNYTSPLRDRAGGETDKGVLDA